MCYMVCGAYYMAYVLTGLLLQSRAQAVRASWKYTDSAHDSLIGSPVSPEEKYGLNGSMVGAQKSKNVAKYATEQPSQRLLRDIHWADWYVNN